MRDVSKMRFFLKEYVDDILCTGEHVEAGQEAYCYTLGNFACTLQTAVQNMLCDLMQVLHDCDPMEADAGGVFDFCADHSLHMVHWFDDDYWKRINENKRSAV